MSNDATYHAVLHMTHYYEPLKHVETVGYALTYNGNSVFATRAYAATGRYEYYTHILEHVFESAVSILPELMRELGNPRITNLSVLLENMTEHDRPLVESMVAVHPEIYEIPTGHLLTDIHKPAIEPAPVSGVQQVINFAARQAAYAAPSDTFKIWSTKTDPASNKPNAEPSDDDGEFYLKNRIQYELVHDIDSQSSLAINVSADDEYKTIILNSTGAKIHGHGIIVVTGTYITNGQKLPASVIYPAGTQDFSKNWLKWYTLEDVIAIADYLQITPTDAGNLVCSLVNADPASDGIKKIDPSL